MKPLLPLKKKKKKTGQSYRLSY